MGAIKISGAGKIYPDKTRALEDVSIEINDGEFVVLVGPSGCGKTTLLRMVAGLEDITEGEISIADKIVNEVAPKDRDIAMVFKTMLYILICQSMTIWLSHSNYVSFLRMKLIKK
jgi:multiple sugar transport system ATP-binding protein